MPSPDDDLAPQSREWCERLATTQDGYFYDWRSVLEPGNGEQRYTELVERELTPSIDVLDAGCGHGLDLLRIAPRVRTALGYDRAEAFVGLARAEADARGIQNLRFVCSDSKRGGIPASDRSIDLFLSRRGPRNWIEDAARVGRPGAVMLMLSPITGDPPAWNQELPELLRFPELPADFPNRMQPTIDHFESRLPAAGATLTDQWQCEVDECFEDPREFYRCRVWGRDPKRLPEYAQVQGVLEALFARHAGDGGLPLPHRRHIFRAQLRG